jgi:hypothetical protein
METVTACPVCRNSGMDGDALLDAKAPGGYFFVWCTRCGVRGPNASTHAAARTKWRGLLQESEYQTKKAIVHAITQLSGGEVATRLRDLEKRAEREDSYRQEQSER